MPKFDSIECTTTDLQNISASIAATGTTGPVRLIDTGNTLVVRDMSDFFITEVEKEMKPISIIEKD